MLQLHRWLTVWECSGHIRTVYVGRIARVNTRLKGNTTEVILASKAVRRKDFRCDEKLRGEAEQGLASPTRRLSIIVPQQPICRPWPAIMLLSMLCLCSKQGQNHLEEIFSLMDYK